jgi:hypothetical protein
MPSAGTLHCRGDSNADDGRPPPRARRRSPDTPVHRYDPEARIPPRGTGVRRQRDGARTAAGCNPANTRTRGTGAGGAIFGAGNPGIVRTPRCARTHRRPAGFGAAEPFRRPSGGDGDVPLGFAERRIAVRGTSRQRRGVRFAQQLSNYVCRLRWDTKRGDSVNRRAEPPLRVDGKLPPHDLQPLLHAGQAEPAPSHRLVRVKAGA